MAKKRKKNEIRKKYSSYLKKRKKIEQTTNLTEKLSYQDFKAAYTHAKEFGQEKNIITKLTSQEKYVGRKYEVYLKNRDRLKKQGYVLSKKFSFRDFKELYSDAIEVGEDMVGFSSKLANMDVTLKKRSINKLYEAITASDDWNVELREAGLNVKKSFSKNDLAAMSGRQIHNLIARLVDTGYFTGDELREAIEYGY